MVVTSQGLDCDVHGLVSDAFRGGLVEDGEMALAQHLRHPQVAPRELQTNGKGDGDMHVHVLNTGNGCPS